MFDVLKATFQIIGLVVAALLIAILLLLIALSVEIHWKNEGHIQSALRSRYPGTVLLVRQRVAREIEWSAQFDNEICFGIELAPGKVEATRRAAMVSSDLDQGIWSFGKEYPSMADCEKHFSRG